MPRESVTEMVARYFRDYKGEICHEKKRDIETAGKRILLFTVMYRYHYESPFTLPPPLSRSQSSGALSGCFGVTPSTMMHLPVNASECKGGRVSPHLPGCAPGWYTGVCGSEEVFG